MVLGRGVLSSWVGARAGAAGHSVTPEGGRGVSTAWPAVVSSGSVGGGGFFGRPRFFLRLKAWGSSSSGASCVGGAVAGDGVVTRDGRVGGGIISFPAGS